MGSWLGDGPLVSLGHHATVSQFFSINDICESLELCNVESSSLKNLEGRRCPSGLIFAFRKVNFDKWRGAGK